MTPSEPTMDPEIASRVLARVPHDRRFPVGRLVPPVGLLPSFVRSLGELELALRPEPRSLAGLDLRRLADWIETAVGDPGGAAAVRDVARTAPSYVDACRVLYERIRDRVASARRALDADAHGPVREGSTR